MVMYVSVIIACYNGAKYLAEAVHGLHAQDIPLEIIVVDDASTDGSAQLAADLGCTVAVVRHGGQAAARNVGLSLSRGNVVMFHDQDDVLRPKVLHKMLAPLREEPCVAVVMAQAMDFLSPDLDVEDVARLVPRLNPYFGFLGATMFRKDVLDDVGGLSEALKAGEAADLLFRVRDAGHVVRQLPFVAMDRRLHAHNTSRLMRPVQFRDYASTLRRHLAVRS